jgi:WD40 repeat protein
MNNTVKNPYVGPRTFQREDGDIFFGREREARDILALIASERLVLFYAQSGAGKSSLLNTRIIPELEDGEFEVLPVGRVQGDLPAGLRVENVFIYNLMNSILQQKTNPQALAKLSLSDFLCKLDFNESGYSFNAQRTSAINTELHWRRVLLIDQFEEIFRLHLHEWRKREEFFRQIAQAMEEDPYLSVMLIMREDYIASLDPYAHILPGGLRMRYYMQRLSRDSALKAIKNPVEHIRPFAAGVAEKLVDDLAGVQVEKSSGEWEVQTGQYVEPVQLQVVCQGLWENLAPDGVDITERDLLDIGDVDQSLQRFYDRRISSIAKERAIPERIVREWFDKKLITGSKTRNMLAQGLETTAGLPNDIVRSLQGDLIRSELRAGQIWVELSHDRLVDPILASNAQWFEQNLSVFQRRVVLWVQQGKSESLLLNEQELAEAEKEASALHVTEDEQEFLEESRKQVQLLKRDKLQRRRLVAALIGSVILLVAAVVLAFYANVQTEIAQDKANFANTQQAIAQVAEEKADASAKDALEKKAEADEQAQKALAGKLAAEADSQKDSDYTLALLLSAKAYELESTILTRTTLFDLLQFTPATRLFGYSGPITSLAISDDGTILASASCGVYSNAECTKGEIILTYTETYQLIRKIPGEYGMVKSLAFTRSGGMLLLAAGGCVPVDDTNKGCTDSKGQITIWNVSDPVNTEPELQSQFDPKHDSLVKTIAFNHKGTQLASGSFDKTVKLWNVSDPQEPKAVGNPIKGHTSFVNCIAFSDDDKTLVSGGDDGNIFLWNISDPNAITQLGTPLKWVASINSLAFNPNKPQFASASNDKTVVLWDWNASTRTLGSPRKLLGHDGYVQSIAFNADGSILASVGFDGKVILWDTKTRKQKGSPLLGHTRAIDAVVFDSIAGTNSLYLFSGGNDRTIIRWDLSNRYPISQPKEQEALPEGIDLEITSGDHSARVENEQQILLDGKELKNGHTGKVNSLQFNRFQDGTLLLASTSNDQTVILWNVSKIDTDPIFLKLEGFNNPVSSAYFDNGQLVTVEKNSGNTVRWDINPAIWKAKVCKNIHLTNDLSAEWKSLIPDSKYQSVCQ